MIKYLALWALKELRKRVKLNGEDSVRWTEFILFLDRVF